MSEIVVDGLSLTEKQDLLKDLKAAYYTGAYRIKFRERDVTYRSAEDMRRIITELEQELGSSPRRRVILTTFRRGY